MRPSVMHKARSLAADSSDKLHPPLAAVEAYHYFVTSVLAFGRRESDHSRQKEKIQLRLPSGDFQRLSELRKLVEKGSWGASRELLPLLFRFPLFLERYEYHRSD